MKSLAKLNRYLFRYRGTVLLGVLFLTAANFFLIWIPVLIRQTMDEVERLSSDYSQSGASVLEVLFSEEAGAILAWNSLFLTGAVAMYGLFLFATRQTLIVSSRKVEYDIRNDILDKLFSLPQEYYSEMSPGELYVRATEDVARVREYFGPVLMYTVNTITRAGFIIVMMIIVSPDLTVWALSPLPLLSAFAYWVSGFIHKYQTLIQEQYSRIAGSANEAFSSIRLIKAYRRESNEQKKFELESEEYRKKKLKLDMVESMFHPTLNLLIGISVIVVIWQGGRMVIEDQLTVGNIAEFIIYVAYLTWPVAALGYTVNRFQKSIASWERIEEVLDESFDIEDDKNTVKGDISANGDIVFENVSFKYPGAEEYAVRDISLTIPSGKRVAFIGRTGSGKSTLIQLIPRLYDPQKGRILLNGIDLKQWPLADLRRGIGYVPQDTFLFSTTIRENIAFGVNEADDMQVQLAAKKAHVLDNILEFEKKFETIVGERGITLSGGQKQRTAIARALIKDPDIIILDDSLSAVDTRTEDTILRQLQEELKRRTTIMISHRISSVMSADIIYYLDDGTLAESGTHRELMALDGQYATTYRKQLIEQELDEI